MAALRSFCTSLSLSSRAHGIVRCSSVCPDAHLTSSFESLCPSHLRAPGLPLAVLPLAAAACTHARTHAPCTMRRAALALLVGLAAACCLAPVSGARQVSRGVGPGCPAELVWQQRSSSSHAVAPALELSDCSAGPPKLRLAHTLDSRQHQRAEQASSRQLPLTCQQPHHAAAAAVPAAAAAACSCWRPAPPPPWAMQSTLCG